MILVNFSLLIARVKFSRKLSERFPDLVCRHNEARQAAPMSDESCNQLSPGSFIWRVRKIDPPPARRPASPGPMRHCRWLAALVIVVAATTTEKAVLASSEAVRVPPVQKQTAQTG